MDHPKHCTSAGPQSALHDLDPEWGSGLTPFELRLLLDLYTNPAWIIESQVSAEVASKFVKAGVARQAKKRDDGGISLRQLELTDYGKKWVSAILATPMPTGHSVVPGCS